MAALLGARLAVQDVEMDDDAKTLLTKIGTESSLRSAVEPAVKQAVEQAVRKE